MKWILAMMIVLAGVFSLLTFAGDDEKTPGEQPKYELKTPNEKLSYALGMQLGEDLKKFKSDMDVIAYTRAIMDVFNDKSTALSREEADGLRKEFYGMRNSEHTKKMKEVGDKNKKEGEAYLRENKNKKGVVTTSSGLQYTITKKSGGAKPKATDKIKVNLRGTMIDGTEIASSYKAGEPFTLDLKDIIPGLKEGLQLMNVGSSYRFVLPSNLAFGENGYGNGDMIGPNAVLIYDIELLSIEK